MRIPSQITDRYWLFELYEAYRFKKPREERASGKWLIFDHAEKIDALWELISVAVQNGHLGPSAKVSTAKPNPNAKDNDTRVICVFTEDFNDQEDVRRIEKELRALGVSNRMIYKLDRDVGKYAHQGEQGLLQQISAARDEQA